MKSWQKSSALTGVMLALVSSFALAAAQPSLVTQKEVTVGKGKMNILAHPSGLTLYTFDVDSGNQSACNAVCAEKWPPYILTDAEAANLPADQGVITRASGTKQLTYDKKPVYLFFADRTSVDAKGDGLGGVWHVIKE